MFGNMNMYIKQLNGTKMRPLFIFIFSTSEEVTKYRIMSPLVLENLYNATL